MREIKNPCTTCENTSICKYKDNVAKAMQKIEMTNVLDLLNEGSYLSSPLSLAIKCNKKNTKSKTDFFGRTFDMPVPITMYM